MGSRIGWGIARVVAVLLALAGLLWPLVGQLGSPGAADDPVTISDYRADLAVDASGTLAAVEDITAQFPGGRHGIFRYWDVADSADPHVRYVPEVRSITMDGAAVPYRTYWESGRFLVAKIGDPDRLLESGAHRYRISYTVPGVLSPPDAGGRLPYDTSVGSGPPSPGSAFLWDVVARGWDMAIARAEVRITLPGPTGLVQCATVDTDAPCAITGAGTDRVTVTAQGLPPRTGVVLRAALTTPAPPREQRPWSVAWEQVLGSSRVLALLVAVLSVLGLVVGLRWARSAREDPPGLPVQYAPPTGLGPAQAHYVMTESVGGEALVATIMHMADRGLVRLDRETSDRWRVTGVADPDRWRSVDPATAAVARALGLANGGTFTADSSSTTAGKALGTAATDLERDVAQWARASGLVTAAASERTGRAVLVGCIVLAGVGFVGLPLLLGTPTMWGMPFAAFVIGGLSLFSTGVGQRRTPAGREQWSRVGGFERLLSTPSAQDRFDFAARKDLFIAYIPYAIVFGVADRWADRYRAAVHEEPPVPMWYPAYAMGGGRSDLYSSGGGFSAAVSGSISAYSASTHSSGGGGSFGGGGGGGGGSW